MATGVILSRDHRFKGADWPHLEGTIEVQSKRNANLDLEKWVATHGATDREYSIWTNAADWQWWLHRPEQPRPHHSVEWSHDDNF